MWNLSLTLPYWAEQWMPDRTIYYIASYWPIDENPHSNYWKLSSNHQISESAKKILRILAFSQLRREKYPPQLNFSRAICVSHYVRHTLITAGILPPNASVIYNGINSASFLPPETGQKTQNQFLRLLYSGRLIRDKGVHTALEALHLLKQQNLIDKVRLTILGSGHPSYEATLRKMVSDYNLDDFVDFASFVPRTQMPDWLNKFDVYLFTSIWPEPMARSVMEAMAAGLLVIGSKVGGQTEMLNHGQNALTFQAEDATDLVNQIAYIIENPSLLLQMARAGQEMVQKEFTLDRMVTEIETYLLQLSHN
jgi:glycosyltransferase involved in cell wall biosynthesis